jgi:hypothetical protein
MKCPPHAFIEAPLSSVTLYSCTTCDAVYVVTPTGTYDGQDDTPSDAVLTT